MGNKYLTLQTIYDLIKNDSEPTKTIVEPSQIILRQQTPWDEIVKHLDELQKEELVTLFPLLSISAVSITEKGFQQASFNSASAA